MLRLRIGIATVLPLATSADLLKWISCSWRLSEHDCFLEDSTMYTDNLYRARLFPVTLVKPDKTPYFTLNHTCNNLSSVGVNQAKYI